MSEIAQKMPFGYEPPKDDRKGSLIYYDTFEHTSERELDLSADIAKERSFSKLVLYPLHEETVKRMSKESVSAYYKREDKLFEWKRERGEESIVVERLEGKRKKYTPIDSALRHLTQNYPAPHFLFVSSDTANLFASFSSFEEWIVKVRLILIMEPSKLHPRLEQYRHRWESIIHA